VGRGGRRNADLVVLRGLLTDGAGNHEREAIADLVRLDDDTVAASLARLEREGLVTSERPTEGRRHWRLTVSGISAVLRSMDDFELLQL
jgi:DNA-binding MarR family transcriptional regulator